MLALSLKDAEMRKFLKSEANKQFDGDFDILVKNVVSASVGNGKSDEKVKKSSSKGYAAGSQAFANAVKNPLLNIAVPVLIENWNETRQLPLVAVAVGANEKETKQLKAFDSNGKTYLIDAKVEPNMPVIVIANNERVNLPGFKTGLQPANQKNARVNALRPNGGMDKITYIKCPDINNIESWYFGGPELQFDGVVYNDSFTAAFKCYGRQVTPSRNSAKNGFTLNQDLFQWYFDDNHGPDYYSQSSEIDGSGAEIKITVGVTGIGPGVNASFELTFQQEDRNLASELIHYSSSVPKTISDSNIIYTITQ